MNILIPPFGHKIVLGLLTTVCLTTAPGCTVPVDKKETGIAVVSYLVRDRVITLDQVTMRSMLIVGARIPRETPDPGSCTVSGELYRDGVIIARDTVHRPDSRGVNLSFDIPCNGMVDHATPMRIPNGVYRIVVRLLDREQRLVSQCSKEVDRSQLTRTFEGNGTAHNEVRYHAVDQKTSGTDGAGSSLDRGKLDPGYRLVQSGPLIRIPGEPNGRANIPLTEVNLQIARDENQTFMFALHADKELGVVKVAAGIQAFRNGVPPLFDVAAVDLLTETVGRQEGDTQNFREAPRILGRKSATIGKGVQQTFRLEVKSGANTPPGLYEGTLAISAEKGYSRSIPLRVTVLPLRLPPDTDIHYGMMMDYAFYELDNLGWSTAERRMLERRGTEIYRDLRDHGMTVAYPHSHFFYRNDEKGDPVLDSLKAALQAYAADGFPGPFVWYLGHLLNTAKPKHPGSILLYDEKVAEKRLRDLLPRLEKMAREAGVPKEKLVVQLVDEPDREDRARTQAAKKLNSIAREMGFRTLITRPWPEVDIICTGTPDDDAEAAKLRSMGKEWWIYPNEALSGRNMYYTRYVFGFGAWRWGVQGVVPWTYQMSEGSNGNPFTVLDGPEIMVTYPGKDGPISTPIWESIREGINDYRYIFMLEKLIAAAKVNRNPAADRIEKQLNLLREQHGRQPGFRENETGDWTAEVFDKKRSQIAAWALELSPSAPTVSNGL